MFKKISLIAFVAVLFASCDIGSENSASCFTIVGVSTVSVTGPTETTINTPILLEVTYKGKKNCGGFESFFKNVSLNPSVDIITVNTSYDPCACDEKITNEKANYTFKKAEPGEYLVKFKATNDTFIEHNVTVQ